MSMIELQTTPGHLLRRGHQIAVAVATEELLDFGLTPVQYTALMAVYENPGIDITALSGMIAFDRSTMGGVLDRLEEKDLMARWPTKTDKRVRLLHLTPAGEKLAIAAKVAADRAQQRILEPLSAAERRQLTTLLTKLVRLQLDNMPASVKTVVDRGTDAG
ncbi:MAG: MarR family winged helix-turn-helix transcriptional regulator [Janthinobacterium lividum]